MRGKDERLLASISSEGKSQVSVDIFFSRRSDTNDLHTTGNYTMDPPVSFFLSTWIQLNWSTRGTARRGAIVNEVFFFGVPHDGYFKCSLPDPDSILRV